MKSWLSNTVITKTIDEHEVKFRRVPVGTEGAISIEGTLAGALTATLVALFGAMAWSSFDSGNPLMLSLDGQRAAWTLKCAGLIALAAIAGSWLESVAGSWNRRHESLISNGTLNFFNTVAGAAMMFALARFLG